MNSHDKTGQRNKVLISIPCYFKMKGEAGKEAVRECVCVCVRAQSCG